MTGFQVTDFWVEGIVMLEVQVRPSLSFFWDMKVNLDDIALKESSDLFTATGLLSETQGERRLPLYN
jgi:hypothetical protein